MASYRSGDAMQPLVFAILKSLTPKDFEISFYDDRVEELNFTEPTDLVAITCGTFTAKRAYQIAGYYRKKNVPVVMGGYHPTLMPEEARLYADAVIIGSAESVWQQVLDDFQNNALKPFYHGEIDGDGLHSSYDYSIFEGKKYFPVNLVEWGRGCRHHCDFCSVQAFNKGKEMLRPVKDVIADISKLDNKPVFFVDDNLYHDKRLFRDLLVDMIPLKKRWACQISVEVTHDEDLLGLMQKSGCMMALLGIESFDRGNLKLMNKSWNFDIGKYREAIQRLRKRHIMVYGTFIFGYDHDTPEDFKKSVDFAIKSKLFIANFNPLYPMPGTKLYERLEAENRLIYEKWWLDPDFYYGKTMFRPVPFSPQDLEKHCLDAKRKFNSFASILHRARDFSANLHGKTNAAFFLLTNLTNRREIFKKQGKKLGTS